MRDDLLAIIRSGCTSSFFPGTGSPPLQEGLRENLFNHLALKIYLYQFNGNLPYQHFCLSQKKTPETVHRWEEIPPLPVTAFKRVDLACRPINEAVQIFHSSGTTRPLPWGNKKESQERRPSRHYLFDHEIARAAILSHFQRHVSLQEKMRLYMLTPSPEETPHSSLSYMMEMIRLEYGRKESDYYIHQGRLLGEKLCYDLSEATEPVLLLGTSFSFVHFIDFHQANGFPIRLPQGSQLMDTGGFKGKSRAVSRHWLYAMIENRLGIPPECCINEYGMSEMTSQFYNRNEANTAYCAPPQTRWQILSPETLKPVNNGEIGLLAFYDLANIDSVLAVLTEDLGREVDGGFELIGRAQDADQKGCSLALDCLLDTLGDAGIEPAASSV